MSSSSSSSKNIENARRMLWGGSAVEGTDESSSATRARSRNPNVPHGSGFSTRDYVVDQSVNLMDIGADDGSIMSSNNNTRRGSGGGGGIMSGLFRASMEVENLNRFDEYGDAAPSADPEEYIDSDKRRRMGPLWASCHRSLVWFRKNGWKVVVSLIGISILLGLSLLVATTTATLVDNSGSGANEVIDKGNNNNNNNNNNTVSNGFGAIKSNNDNVNDKDNSQRYTNIQTRIVQERVTPQEFFDTASPQQSALDWLVDDDPAKLGYDHPALLDRYGLAVFYYSSNNAPKTSLMGGWKNSENWMTESGICSWHGVECVLREQEATAENDYTPFTKTYDDNARITGIRLEDNHMEGRIPEEWGSGPAMEELLTLDLENNQLSHTLPTTLGLLPKLRDLLVKGNALVGTLPEEYAALTKLHQLNLSINQFEGPIPNSWSRLKELRFLAVARNLLTGTFPDLSKMTRMTGLSLEDNDFEGNLPESIGTLTGLLDLRIGQNKFSGPLTALASLQNLETLHINNNAFTGSIPDMFDHLFRLHELVMQSNQFVGSIPLTLTHLQSLKTLNLASNQLDGSIPPGLGLLTNAVVISLDHNQFEGAIPTLLGRLDDIIHLSLNHNSFSGTIPTELGGCFRLIGLSLEHNQLTGEIPPQIGELTGLESLRLESNKLVGVTMPSQICALRDDDLTVLAADCAVDEQVSCTCCTKCL